MDNDHSFHIFFRNSNRDLNSKLYVVNLKSYKCGFDKCSISLECGCAMSLEDCSVTRGLKGAEYLENFLLGPHCGNLNYQPHLLRVRGSSNSLLD